jgi:Gas vesicle synthesis protein GvpL/GvpF.
MRHTHAVILYLYAIGRSGHPLPAPVEAIDGSDSLILIEEDGLAAFCSQVDESAFSQEVIDGRSKDLEWLGAIGYRHQSVMAALMRGGTIIPLRAFSLFRSGESVREHLREQGQTFLDLLSRLKGRQEWTLRIEFDPAKWNDSLIHRVDTLRILAADIESASAGKAFLLQKKLDDQKKKSSREAEESVVAEIEEAILEKLACRAVSESRQARGGAFPQINVLIERDEEAQLVELCDTLNERYAEDGVSLALTGPWPPYTFASMDAG